MRSNRTESPVSDGDFEQKDNFISPDIADETDLHAMINKIESKRIDVTSILPTFTFPKPTPGMVGATTPKATTPTATSVPAVSTISIEKHVFQKSVLVTSNIQLTNEWTDIAAIPYNGVRYNLESILVYAELNSETEFVLSDDNNILGERVVPVSGAIVFEMKDFKIVPKDFAVLRLQAKCNEPNLDFDTLPSYIYSSEFTM
jgi:hypothetical protein